VALNVLLVTLYSFTRLRIHISSNHVYLHVFWVLKDHMSIRITKLTTVLIHIISCIYFCNLSLNKSIRFVSYAYFWLSIIRCFLQSLLNLTLPSCHVNTLSTTAQSWNEHIVALLILFPAWILSYSSSAQLSPFNIRLVVAHLVLIILTTMHQKPLQQLPPLWPPRLSQHTIQLFNLVSVYPKKES
jgi:hypothetical protein